MVDMSAFIAVKSDQLNADDLMDSPRTITITKVTARPDAAEQPVSIHYEGDAGKPWRPCKTCRRILVGVWGRDASKYAGRSLTLFRDPEVKFGGLQVGGIRVSHMSHMDGEKVLALMVKQGRKAPFKILPLASAPKASGKGDYSAELASLKDIAKPGNMDALGAAWKEIGADARKALAAELPALKAACNQPAEDIPFDAKPTLADQIEDTPAEAKARSLVQQLDTATGAETVEALVTEAEQHREALGDLMTGVEIAADKARNRVASAQGELVK